MHDTARSRGRGYAQTCIALLVGFTLMAIALGVTLAGRPLTVLRTNAIRAEAQIGTLQDDARVCQGGEVLPRDASAIRVSLFAFVGPRATLEALSGARTLDSGTASGWTGEVVTFGLEHVPRTSSHVSICIAFGPTIRSVAVGGSRTSAAVAARSHGEPLAGRMRIE